MELVSDCCGAELIYIDICSDCREHSEATDLNENN